MQEWSLSADATRTMVALQQLLRKDHRIAISLSEDNVMEHLFDATRASHDNKAEGLARSLCQQLRDLNSGASIDSLCSRLKADFDPERIEQYAGIGIKQLYRGRTEAASDDSSASSGDASAPDKPKPKRMYRGRVVE